MVLQMQIYETFSSNIDIEHFENDNFLSAYSFFHGQFMKCFISLAEPRQTHPASSHNKPFFLHLLDPLSTSFCPKGLICNLYGQYRLEQKGS